jgi:PEP-CTERM motif
MTGITKTAVLLTVLAGPVIADECPAGSFVSIQNTTCDIGILTFNFGAVQAMALSYDNATGAPLPTTFQLNPADFEFDPLPTSQVAFGKAVTGYAITSLTGPQIVTSPPNGFSIAVVSLGFSVTSQAGDIVAAGVGGSMINVSGVGYGLSQMEVGDFGSGALVSARDENGFYDTISRRIPAGDTANGSSIIFQLVNFDGGSGEWFGPTETFSLFTETPVPEPNSLMALVTVLGLCSLFLRRRFTLR